MMAIIDNMNGLFWMNGSNFGDLLSRVVYKEITGKEPAHAQESPKIISIGSLAHTALPGDVLWGTGCISPSMPLMCDETTTALCVRGPFTDSLLRLRGVKPAPVFGDPSLLLPRYVKPAKERIYTLGIVPHYADAHVFDGLDVPDNCLVIYGNQDPYKVIEQITSCRTIVSSSLHGIVVAEAYGIGATWAEFSDLVAGRGFKFYDYYAGTGRQGIAPLDFRGVKPIVLFETIKDTVFKSRYMLLQYRDKIARLMLECCPYERSNK